MQMQLSSGKDNSRHIQLAFLAHYWIAHNIRVTSTQLVPSLVYPG